MSSVKISPESQRNLRNNAKAELTRLETIQDNVETIKLLDEFKNKFNICESVYKVVLKEHQIRKGKTDTNYLKLIMTQVPFALSFAGYSFEKDLLNELFGSSSKKGMTVKKLRDAVTHGIDEKAAKEISDRKEELFGYMDVFLNTIRNFDQSAA
ncbi:MAG: hypothetical protein J6J18_07465 [Oscillospiraceae bacterium]|nr:hypothetical protein [Oscillospiraceae bacterium]